MLFSRRWLILYYLELVFSSSVNMTGSYLVVRAFLVLIRHLRFLSCTIEHWRAVLLLLRTDVVNFCCFFCQKSCHSRGPPYDLSSFSFCFRRAYDRCLLFLSVSFLWMGLPRGRSYLFFLSYSRRGWYFSCSRLLLLEVGIFSHRWRFV